MGWDKVKGLLIQGAQYVLLFLGGCIVITVGIKVVSWMLRYWP